MTFSLAPRSCPGPLTPESAEELAAALVAEMILLWRRGERRLPEDFLARYPALWDHPEAAAELIYEEMSLRREHGPPVPTEEILRRFPQWQPQLEVLFDCHRVLAPRAAPCFPASGETVDDFLLLAELGSGAIGRVFLASEISLADRLVVLKFIPLEAREHLSLARLQHTHIVPLYSAQDHPKLGLRSLCMPYFGGVALSRLLESLRPVPPSRRTGQDLLAALDGAQAATPVLASSRTATRQGLARATFVQAVCWVGACLADGLHYAHERGLVHLDLKPSNVLVAADGQPMLLDFHLAREPIRLGGEKPHRFGGTPGYMSPEQRDAMDAFREGRSVSRPVDERSDVYSLGVVLYEALTGSLPTDGRKFLPARCLNPQVSVGLTDVIGKCLSEDLTGRYRDAAALAADLRRHLADLPLCGVRNRSLAERWRKWQRRRPHAATLLGMTLAVVTAAGAVALGATAYLTQRTVQAENALHDGQLKLARGEWEGAVATLQHGLSAAHDLPFKPGLANELGLQLHRAEQARAQAGRVAATRELHQLADLVRFFYGANLPPQRLRAIDASCRAFWNDRTRIVARLSPDGPHALASAARQDLLDLAIFYADLRLRQASPAEMDKFRQQALEVLSQAEALFGPSPVLDQERASYGDPSPTGKPPSPPRTAWEHYALGRSLLRGGAAGRAAHEMEQAVLLEPQGLWPNFYHGLCAYRLGRYNDAVSAFSVCIGAAPEAASCFYNRALAFDALGRPEQALRDYDQALQLDPTLADAALNRGVLHYRARRYDAARADLRRAGELGSHPAIVSFDLFLVNRALGCPH